MSVLAEREQREELKWISKTSPQLRSRGFERLTMLPYNWRSPPSTKRWWLSPSAEKIAFPYGKITVASREPWIDDDKVFIGFNVEKGIARPEVRGDSCVMKPNWFWHHFVEIAATPLQIAVEEAAEKSKSSIQIIVSCGVEVPKAETPIPGDIVRLEFENGVLTPHVIKSDDGSLAPLAHVHTFADLASTLRTLTTGHGWHWCDLLVGAPYDAESFEREQVDQAIRMLRPFEPWFR